MTAILVAVLLLLGGCGDGDGNNDTMWTGLSGVVIFTVAAVVVVRTIHKRKARKNE